MEAIRAWLEGEQRDYAAGVALYQVHGTSETVGRLLAYGETAFTRGKLVEVLEQLLGAAPATPCAHVVDTSAERVDESAERVQVDPQRRDWFAERNYLHAQLELVATEEERCDMALRILALGKLISQSYDRERGSQAPAAAAPAPPGEELASLDDTGEIRRILGNLRAQRSKLKNRPDRAADLAQVKADILVLEQKLRP